MTLSEELREACENYLDPDRDLIRELPQKKTLADLRACYDKARTPQGFKAIKKRACELALCDTGEDENPLVLLEKVRLLIFAGALHGSQYKSLRNRIYAVIDSLVENPTGKKGLLFSWWRGLQELEAENVTVQCNGRIHLLRRKLDEELLRLAADEKDPTRIEALLFYADPHTHAYEVLQKRYDATRGILHDLDNLSPKEIKWRRGQAQHPETHEVLSQQLDRVNGITEKIESAGFQELVALFKKSASQENKERISARLYALIMTMDPRDPPLWFMFALRERPLDIFHGVLERKARAVLSCAQEEERQDGHLEGAFSA